MHTMSSDNYLDQEILLQTDDYPAPSPTEAPFGLNADMPSTTPTLPQADLATARSNGGRINLAKMYKPARDCASAPHPASS